MCSVYGPGGDLDSFLLQILRCPGNARSHLVFLTPKHMNLNFDDHPMFATCGCEIENIWVSENWGTQKSSISVGFSIINQPCWDTRMTMETSTCGTTSSAFQK
jgi:hypothetical protein